MNKNDVLTLIDNKIQEMKNLLVNADENYLIEDINEYKNNLKEKLNNAIVFRKNNFEMGEY